VTYYLHGWLTDDLSGGLVTSDLTSGERLVLAHTDQRLAMSYADAILRRFVPEGRIATMSLDCSVEELCHAVAGMVGPSDGIQLVLPDDPVYLEVINQTIV
jgi:hypothetical protein